MEEIEKLGINSAQHFIESTSKTTFKEQAELWLKSLANCKRDPVEQTVRAGDLARVVVRANVWVCLGIVPDRVKQSGQIRLFLWFYLCNKRHYGVWHGDIGFSCGLLS